LAQLVRISWRACLAITSSSLVAMTRTGVGLDGALIRVELHAEEREAFAHLGAHLRRVLADAAGEHEQVEAAERRGQGADRLAHRVRKHRHRQARARIALGALGEHPHVASAADRQEARFPIDELLERVRTEPVLARQVEQDAGVKVTGPRPHQDPARRREPHRGVDRAAILDGRQAGAAAQVGDHHARGRVGPERGHHVLVREAVEAVATNVLEARRQRQHAGDLGQGGVERGVEADDLRQPRMARRHRFDAGEARRHVER
jgi:hypothetical protein